MPKNAADILRSRNPYASYRVENDPYVANQPRMTAADMLSAGDYWKGLASGALGWPADIIQMMADARASQFGAPRQEVPMTTDQFREWFNVNRDSEAFQAGSIGLPDAADIGKIAPHWAMTLFHGTPHKFDRFRLADDTIGTGEGAQAYGHGLYFAESKGVANNYKRQLSDTVNVPESTPEIEKRAAQMAVNFGGDDPVSWLSKFFDRPGNHLTPAMTPELARSVAGKFDDGTFTPGGHLYEVDIPDEHINKMMDWDAPLSEQPDGVRGILEAWQREVGTSISDGESVLKEIAFERRMNGLDDSPAAVSQQLREMGIPGIRYYDGASRSAGNGTRNVVLFDDSLIKSVKRNGENLY